MTKATVFLFTGTILLCAGSVLASDQPAQKPAKEAVENFCAGMWHLRASP